MESTSIGFLPEEVRTGESTRTARLKWVVVVDDALPGGRAANAAVCVAAATSVNIAGLLGPDGSDATGSAHPGLPWAGCSILAANTGQLNDIRARAVARADVFVADMPSHAQRTRVYDEYLEHLARAGDDQITYSAVSIVGPRNAVDKLVKRLPLLP
jgi:uncharacterized protein DUF2000